MEKFYRNLIRLIHKCRSLKLSIFKTFLTIIYLLGSNITYAIDEASDNIEVTAEVVPSCRIETNPMAFDRYRLFNLYTSTTIFVLCTNHTRFNIGIDASHKMKGNKQSALNYELYQDSKMSKIWGNTKNTMLSGVGIGKTQEITVYGKIRENQIVDNGSYSDVAYVSISFGDSKMQNLSYQLSVRMRIFTDAVIPDGINKIDKTH